MKCARASSRTDMTAAVQEKYDRLIAEGLTAIAALGPAGGRRARRGRHCRGCLPYSTGEVIYVDGGFHLRRL